MKIAVASNIVLDSIQDRNGQVIKSLGGPASYCGLTARQFGFEVILASRVGRDFSLENRQVLYDNGIDLKNCQLIEEPYTATTKFRIILNEENKDLFLDTKCAPLSVEDIQKIQTDCWLVSPVIDEVPCSVLKAIVKDGGKRNFVMLDPQGYTRIVGSYGKISIMDNLVLDLAGITAIKVDRGELLALTGGLEGVAGMQFLQSAKRIKFVISTEPGVVHLLHNKMHYWIQLKNVDTPDSTGVGDILSAAFCCAYLREKDPLWAICFGAGALRAALETKLTGLSKIPSKSRIEQSASYYYNTIEFKST